MLVTLLKRDIGNISDEKIMELLQKYDLDL
jgi:hypothetical protein